LLNGPAEAEKGAGCFAAMRPGGIFNAGSNGTALDEKKAEQRMPGSSPFLNANPPEEYFHPGPFFSARAGRPGPAH
jgi:hypothetical protein